MAVSQLPAPAPGFDPGPVRRQFPALGDGAAYLDGAAGTQVPRVVIDAIANAYLVGLGNTGGAFAASRRSEEIVGEARRAVADLVGGVADGVILGPNMTTLTYRLSYALGKSWAPGDEVVVSQLDHDANVRPWVQAAQRAGAQIRWARVDPTTGELGSEQYQELVGPRTRLVAVTAASNLLGIRPAVAEITAIAHRAGALTYIDGVHATPHGPIDVGALGADFYVTSAYKWCGPHVGAVVADPELLEAIIPDKLLPSSDQVPERFETGTPPFADYAGVAAAVDHLAGLLPSQDGTRRRRLLASMAAVERSESRLFAELLSGLASMAHVTLYGRSADRAPTAYFRVRGHAPAAVAAAMARRQVNVWSGHNYAWELTGALGIRDSGSAVRAGLVHYNDASDVERLLAGVAGLSD
ncbi:MAG: cysteine desulfurase-like protein [Candidatus Dormibacteria bacterium]